MQMRIDRIFKTKLTYIEKNWSKNNLVNFFFGQKKILVKKNVGQFFLVEKHFLPIIFFWPVTSAKN